MAIRRLLGVLSAIAMVGASVAPAMARDHGRYGYGRYGYGRYGYGRYGYPGYGYPYRHRHRHHNGLDAGDVIGIAALIGAVAVIASAANKDKDRRSSRPYEPYPDRDRNSGRQASSEDEAVNACVSAARDEAERGNSGYAEILDVEQPRAYGEDGWTVEGRLEQRRGYQDREGETSRFSCDVRGGRVADVRLSRDVI